MKKSEVIREIVLPMIIIAVIALPSGVVSSAYVSYKKDYKEATKLFNEEKYGDAKSILYSLQSNFISKINSRKITSMLGAIEDYNNTMDNYNKGEAFFNEKKFAEALEYYNKIPQRYKSAYDLAQEKIIQCREGYFETSINEAKKAGALGKYNEAIAIIEDVLKINSQQKEALELKTQYLNAIEISKEKERKAEEIKKLEEIKKAEAVKKAEEAKKNTSNTNKPGAGNNSSGNTPVKTVYPKIVSADGKIQIIETEAQDKVTTALKGYIVAFEPDAFAFAPGPAGLHYKITTKGEGPANLSYNITIKYNGETKTYKYATGSENRVFVPKGEIKNGVKGVAEVTFTYKGKNYKFTKSFVSEIRT